MAGFRTVLDVVGSVLLFVVVIRAAEGVIEWLHQRSGRRDRIGAFRAALSVGWKTIWVCFAGDRPSPDNSTFTLLEQALLDAFLA